MFWSCNSPRAVIKTAEGNSYNQEEIHERLTAGHSSSTIALALLPGKPTTKATSLLMKRNDGRVVLEICRKAEGSSQNRPSLLHARVSEIPVIDCDGIQLSRNFLIDRFTHGLV